MKTLTLTQPWASLVACGAKRFETRSWAPPWSTPSSAVGERIAIHAAKGWTDKDRFIATTEPFKSALREGYARGLIERPSVLDLPRGCVVAIATLAACYPTTTEGGRPCRPLELLLADPLYPHERVFGAYRPGRYAWVLRGVLPIKPIPVRGALGLWDWQPPDWLTYVNASARLAARVAAAQARGEARGEERA